MDISHARHAHGKGTESTYGINRSPRVPGGFHPQKGITILQQSFLTTVRSKNQQPVLCMFNHVDPIHLQCVLRNKAMSHTEYPSTAPQKMGANRLQAWCQAQVDDIPKLFMGDVKDTPSMPSQATIFLIMRTLFVSFNRF